jgi:hypothetical protein
VDVIVDMANGGEAGLHVITHLLLIEINGGCGFADERSILLETLEVLSGGLVDDRRIRVGVGGQVDLGAVDVEEAVWLAFRERGGFLAIDDVIRDAGDFGGELRSRGETFESADSEHEGGEERLG